MKHRRPSRWPLEAKLLAAMPLLAALYAIVITAL